MPFFQPPKTGKTKRKTRAYYQPTLHTLETFLDGYCGHTEQRAVGENTTATVDTTATMTRHSQKGRQSLPIEQPDIGELLQRKTPHKMAAGEASSALTRPTPMAQPQEASATELTACVHASASLLYPMYWQHIYIPVLPPHLLDYCCAPMPYLIGVHFSLMERLKSRSLDDVVLLNVDTNSLETPFNDLCALPADVVSTLKSKLKKQSTSTGDGVSRAFLRAQAALFGSYRDALRYKPGEPVTFCEESFVAHRSSTMRQFLEMAVNLQLFTQFIDGRLEKLNSGRGFSDIFEEEITSGGFCGGNSNPYQQWVHTMKKGSALINTAMTKASPAMKNAYKFAKQGMKEVKSKLKNKDIEEEDMGNSLEHMHTQKLPLNHSNRTGIERRKLSKTRMNRPLQHTGNHNSGPEDSDVGDSASKLSSEDSEEASGYFYDSDASYDDVSLSSRKGGEMDLLGEILDTLSTHSSDPGAGRLTAAKSLDFFRSVDDLDYKVAGWAWACGAVGAPGSRGVS
ncbi:DENN domain-containing 1B isoform X1 [Pelobates cultripes]|uniref:DENN domain-containing 1B isoform X1 n=1 Tax=Pelobates cultripes TaxID=61616 RepID=A0AAD1SUX4_PELCU|nr:DENN domain-containing 1B isoform X1 [Pelobates cultripes]